MLLLLRFHVFTFFFENPKKSDFFYFFAVFHTFSRTMIVAYPCTVGLISVVV